MKQSRLIKIPWKKGQYQTKVDIERNKNRQRYGASRVPELLGMLTDLDNKEFPVEYFFFANTEQKASVLANALSKMGYTVYGYAPCAHNKSLYSICGCTPKMKITGNVMSNWAEQMCELEFDYDCKFDGWGTSPDME
ncbi:MAG: ribonuclease E inhibitor RraB [Taibaiella sp.]|nr:ribonuclease E inhibitor RraB [Taibaiella sp.]